MNSFPTRLFLLGGILLLCVPALAQETGIRDTRFKAYVDGLFKKYDENSDGSLDANEWSRISGSTRLVDANGDGVVDRQEALASISGMAAEKPPSRTQPAAIDGVLDEWTEDTAESRTQEVAEVDLLMSSEEVPKQFRWKDTDDSLTRMQKQRVVLLLKASEVKRQRYEQGTGELTSYLEIQIQATNAIVELDISDEEKLDALASALEYAREIERMTTRNFNAGKVGADDWYAAAAGRLELEIRIERWKQSR